MATDFYSGKNARDEVNNQNAWGFATLSALLLGFSVYLLTAASNGFGLLALGAAMFVFSIVLIVVYGIHRAMTS